MTKQAKMVRLKKKKTRKRRGEKNFECIVQIKIDQDYVEQKTSLRRQKVTEREQRELQVAIPTQQASKQEKAKEPHKKPHTQPEHRE